MNSAVLNEIVEVEEGKLRGHSGINYEGETFLQFQGIPYANPPKRFQLASPPSPWSGIRDATQQNVGSYRYDLIQKKLEGSEDCLYLNIYTKKLPDSKNDFKPVMFWIHSGGFVVGNCRTDSAGPEFLLTEDIVLVTHSYRLGIVGFLNFEDDSLPTTRNLGLKDQRLALQWVQRNIQKFGGDPNNVTLFGGSSGAISGHYHILSRDSKDLFHKVIMQSGSALSGFAQGDLNIIKVVKEMGHDVKSEKEAFDILLKAPIENIHEAQDRFGIWHLPSTQRLVGPFIEPPGTPSTIITQPPIEIITAGHYNDVPCMIGFTADEGIFIEAIPKIKPDIKSASDCAIFIPYFMNVEKGSELSVTLSEMIYKKYFERGGNYNRNLYDVVTDSIYRMASTASIKQHAKTSKQPVFAYKMTIETKLNMKNLKGYTKEPGAAHSDEMGYLFKTALTPQIEKGSIEDISLRKFVKLWTNFAKFGNPTPNKETFGTLWEPVTNPEEIKTLIIGEDLKIETNPDRDRVEFWKSLLQHSSHTSKYL